jgi:nucleoside permease NupC
MRHLFLAGLAAVGMAALAAPASAQSMNVPEIVDTVMGQICVPYAETGDVVAAVTTAQSLGYRLDEDESAVMLDRSLPSAMVRLNRRHHGTITLELSYGNGMCSVGIFEGNPANMSPAAAPHIARLGLQPVLVSHQGQPTTDIAVWRSGTTQLVISRSPYFSPGSELVLSFRLP